MEKRVLIAIILSLAVLLLWQALFPPPQPEKTTEILPEQQRQDAQLPSQVTPPEEEQKAAITPSSIPSPQPDRSSLPPEREIVITTDLYRATFSSHGACLKRFELLGYKNKQPLPEICFIFPFSLLYGEKEISQDISYKELIGNEDMNGCPLQTFLKDADGISQHAVFTEDVGFLELGENNPQGTVTFSGTSPEGVILTKQFTFFNDSYYIDYEFSLENSSSIPTEIQPAVGWPQAVRQEAQEKSGGFFSGGMGGDIQQFSYLIGDTLNRTEIKDI